MWGICTPFHFSPDHLGVPEEILHYILHCSPPIYHMYVAWHVLCFPLLVPDTFSKSPRPDSESWCSHQGNLCPWSSCIYWAQSCRIQSQPSSLLLAFLLKPPDSHLPAPSLWDFCMNSWRLDYRWVTETEVSPIFKALLTLWYWFTVLETLLSFTSQRYDIFSKKFSNLHENSLAIYRPSWLLCCRRFKLLKVWPVKYKEYFPVVKIFDYFSFYLPWLM